MKDFDSEDFHRRNEKIIYLILIVNNHKVIFFDIPRVEMIVNFIFSQYTKFLLNKFFGK